MKINPKEIWQKYKADFLQFNGCTDLQFKADWIAFIKGTQRNPTTEEYCEFAFKYGITIVYDPDIPKDVRVALSVNIAVMKVVAQTFEEIEGLIQGLLSLNPSQEKINEKGI